MAELLRKGLVDTSRGRMVALLRSGATTTEDLASGMGLTRSAIRIHLAAMERDGVVRRVGKKPGTTRPSLVFELTPEIEQLLSKAYLPVLTCLVQVFTEALPPKHLERLLRDTGERLAAELLQDAAPGGNLDARVTRASAMLNEQLGAMTHVERNGAFVIRGAGCPLAALTGKHPGVCRAMESLVAHVVKAPVTECCDRADRPRCCFRIPKRSPVRT